MPARRPRRKAARPAHEPFMGFQPPVGRRHKGRPRHSPKSVIGAVGGGLDAGDLDLPACSGTVPGGPPWDEDDAPGWADELDAGDDDDDERRTRPTRP